jgi:hypothetical protein
MAGKPNVDSIGQDRGTPNPQDAIEREEGKYRDAVVEAPMEDKFQQKILPQAPAPRPFKF